MHPIIQLTSCNMLSKRALAPIRHVRVAVVAVVAPADVAIGAACGVDALAVFADTAKLRARLGRRARRLANCPVQHDWDHLPGHMPQGEKPYLERRCVRVAPPLLLHHEHAGAGGHPRRPSRGVRLQPGKPDVEGRGEASRDGRLAAADPVARPVLKLPLLGARAGWRARRAERGGGGVPSPRGGLEAAADEDEAVPRGGERVLAAEAGREHVYLGGPRGAGGEGPDRAADAHRAVPEGHLQHLRAAAPEEEPRRLVRAVAGDLEARSVAAVAGAERVRHVHAAALALAAGQGDARRSRRRGGGRRELQKQQHRHGEATRWHLTPSRRLTFEFASLQYHLSA